MGVTCVFDDLLNQLTLKPLLQLEFSFGSQYMGFLDGSVVKNPPVMQRMLLQSLGQEDPWRRRWQPTPVFLPGESLWTEEPGGLQSMRWRIVRHD